MLKKLMILAFSSPLLKQRPDYVCFLCTLFVPSVGTKDVCVSTFTCLQTHVGAQALAA